MEDEEDVGGYRVAPLSTPLKFAGYLWSRPGASLAWSLHSIVPSAAVFACCCSPFAGSERSSHERYMNCVLLLPDITHRSVKTFLKTQDVL